MALYPAELPLGLDEPRRRPAEHHASSPPALHVARDLLHATDQVLDRVRRAEGLVEGTTHAKPDQREGLLEPLADRGRGSWMIPLELLRKVKQLPLRLGRCLLSPRLANRGPHPGAPVLGKVLQNVSQLVDLAPLHQAPLTERGPDSLADSLASVQNEQPSAFD